MQAVSLLFHDVYVADPRESGFASATADRYKLSGADFDAQLESLAGMRRGTPALVTNLMTGVCGGDPGEPHHRAGVRGGDPGEPHHRAGVRGGDPANHPTAQACAAGTPAKSSPRILPIPS